MDSDCFLHTGTLRLRSRRAPGRCPQSQQDRVAHRNRPRPADDRHHQPRVPRGGRERWASGKAQKGRHIAQGVHPVGALGKLAVEKEQAAGCQRQRVRQRQGHYAQRVSPAWNLSPGIVTASLERQEQQRPERQAGPCIVEAQEEVGHHRYRQQGERSPPGDAAPLQQAPDVCQQGEPGEDRHGAGHAARRVNAECLQPGLSGGRGWQHGPQDVQGGHASHQGGAGAHEPGGSRRASHGHGGTHPADGEETDGERQPERQPAVGEGQDRRFRAGDPERQKRRSHRFLYEPDPLWRDADRDKEERYHIGDCGKGGVRRRGKGLEHGRKDGHRYGVYRRGHTEEREHLARAAPQRVSRHGELAGAALRPALGQELRSVQGAGNPVDCCFHLAQDHAQLTRMSDGEQERTHLRERKQVEQHGNEAMVSAQRSTRGEVQVQPEQIGDKGDLVDDMSQQGAGRGFGG